MARQPTRSSRELHAAALESERSQQENELRSQSLEAQIAALRAQQEAADNDAQKHRMEKEARQQAAREQSFHETCSKAQGALRTRLADEVYTRVAQALDDPEIWQSLEDIAQGDFNMDQADKLKVMLWEAIAGDDNKFITNAAAKVLDRKEKLISDADVHSIQLTDVCLQSTNKSAHTLPAEKKSYADVSEIEDSTMTDGVFTHEAEDTVSEAFSHHPAVPVAGSTQHGSGFFDTLDTNDTNTHIEAEPIAIRPDVSHKAMTELEEEETANMTAQSSIIQDDHESTSSIPSPVSPRSDLNVGIDVAIPRTDLRKSTTPKKRISKDKSNPTNKDGSPRATKRPKAPGEGNSGSSQRVEAFVENNKFITPDGFKSIDFRCAECVKLVEKDARITNCLHLYHNDCLKSIRGGSTGKQAYKIKCHRTGCGEEMGIVHILANKALQHLKKTYGTATNDGGVGDVTDEDDNS